MIFSSHIFLLYFLPLFLLAYFLVPPKGRNIVLLFASIVFYAWGAPDFILILLASTVANFYLVKAMHRATSTHRKKLFCLLAILLSLGLLAYFKYANFFVDNANALLAAFGLGTMGWTKVLLPIGISFFTFQSITYVVDTYRGVNAPMQRLTDYMVYIIMFPQLIAGPIVRYTDIADQITARRRLRWEECLQGFYRFVIGLSKKVLIADVIGRTVDVALGGDLWIDLPSQRPSPVAHRQEGTGAEPSHGVRVLPDTPLRAICGRDELRVNSLHHQAIRTLAPALELMAEAEDGLPEAAWLPGKRFVFGVQWHPEILSARDEASRAIFRRFAEACGE